MAELLLFLLLVIMKRVAFLVGRALRAEGVSVREEVASMQPPVPRPRTVRFQVKPSPTGQYVGPAYAARASSGTECQICGTALQGDLVSCRDCSTLHHGDCWTYSGGCSTYGCPSALSRR